jgi:CheY-like chemotaxis protein
MKNILYVEDDEISVAVVTFSLSKYYSIDVAKNAEIALKKMNENVFDAILMDINLGRGMNGEELTQVARKIPGYEQTPIIAVTAYAAEEDKNEFLANGMTHYISKPFLIQDLVKLLQNVFEND